MPRPAKVWWNKQKQAWFTELGGARRMLAKGKSNKSLAKEKLQALLDEQALLAQVNGAITVAALCDAFLEDALHNLERRTYESYQYGCQKFVDLFAARAAHTIGPQDVSQFARGIKKFLNPTSQAIVLRSVERCFNWGVESRLIPSHKLGRIRKPRALRRDRYLNDEEFQALLRATNPEYSRRLGALPKMKRLLEWMRRHHKSEFCFLNSKGKQWTVNAINQRMARVRLRCGLKGICTYTLRHRAATNAILRTGDLKMVSLLLGHTSTATTERYVHLAQDHLVAFAKKAAG
jgi:site-specific recombinase XerD